MPQPLQIRTLGGLQVIRDGESAELPASRKTRALLAYLAVTARSHRRERLCELFWEMPDDPRGALRWSLAKIRPLVDDEQVPRIVATRDSVRFEPREAQVDVLRLRDALQDGIDSLSPARLTQLAAQFSGDFLDGLDIPGCPGFQSWLVAEREATRTLRRRVLSALIAACGDDTDAALIHARALVESDPRDEAAQIGLIRVLIRAGRLREAREQHRIAMRSLEDSDTGAAGPLAAVLREIESARPRLSGASATAPVAAPDVASLQQIRFCIAGDGVRIAYSTAGSGPPLVKAANWLNHLEFDWRSPICRHLLDLLTENHTLVRYDERGNGLSDLDAEDISFEAFVRDLEAVVDASGVERFPLFGISQGCAVAIAYAVRHPERVTRLVLHGGYARGWRKRGDSDEISAREALLTLTRTGWGRSNPAFRQVFTSLFFPDATPEQVNWFNELQRISTTPDNAVRLLQAMADIDVSDLLHRVRVPALVTHCTGDARAPFEGGRNLAREIPGARFVQLDSRNHLMLGHEPAWARFAAEVRAFLASGC